MGSVISMNSKRHFRTIALLAPSVRFGTRITNPRMGSLYRKLRDLGFAETPWQYVFSGQVGGLVLSHTKANHLGRNEVHVRFYADRIFAEFEIGRAYISHFFGPRLNANRELQRLLGPHLSTSERGYLAKLMSHERLLVDEAAMQEWSGEDYFRTLKVAQGGGLVAMTRALAYRAGWLSVFGVALCAAYVATGMQPFIGAVGALFGFVGVLVLPSRGRP